MYKLLISSLFILLFQIGKAQDTTKVLFIGNSITYFNDMPQTFEDIANSKGDLTAVTMYAPGGTGFINHVNDPNVYSHFAQDNWDYVVLQPGSNESPGYSEPIEATLTRARQLKDSIHYHNPCAKVLYYEISYGVWGSSASDLTTYNNTMDLIRGNLEHLADSTETFFAPAGEAMRTAWNDDLNTLLWGGTGDIHPNAKGSYIIACSFYASIFQKPSLGTNVISSLTAAEAEEYQQLADTTVLNYLSDWRINTYNQHTDFDFSTGANLNVDFTSTSTNIDSLQWDFGDGNTSDQASLTHSYSQNGTYTVELTTYQNGCEESVLQIVNLMSADVEALSGASNNVNVYPNPFSNSLFIESTTTDEVSIVDLTGKLLMDSISMEQTENGILVNTSQLASGTYFVHMKNGQIKVTKH